MSARATAPAPAPPRDPGAATEDAEAERGAAGLRRLLRNGASLLGAYVIPRICTFAAVVVAARVLGVTTFGLYGTAAALAVMFSIAATLGMMQLLVRELARAPDRAPSLVGAANLAKAVSVVGMMGALAFFVAGPLAYPPDVVAATLLLGAGYGVGAFVENLGAWFQAVERMEVWMQAQALFGVVTGLTGIALALGTRSLVWFCVAPILGQVAALAWLMTRAPPGVRSAWRAPRAEVAGLLRALAPFTVAVVVLTVYTKVDILIVERIAGAVEAGIYAAAFKFVDVVQALALVAATAIYPRLSRLAGRGTAGAGRAAGRTADLLLLVGVPGAACLWLLRAPVVHTLFGVEYAGSVGVLFLLAPALPALTLNILGSTVLAAADRMSVVAALYGGGLAVRVVCNLVLVPRFGAEGAAGAAMVAETTLLLGMVLALRRLAGATLSPRVALAAGATAAVAALLAVSGWPGPVTVVGLGIATVVAYGAGRVVPRHEWDLLREAISR